MLDPSKGVLLNSFSLLSAEQLVVASFGGKSIGTFPVAHEFSCDRSSCDFYWFPQAAQQSVALELLSKIDSKCVCPSVCPGTPGE